MILSPESKLTFMYIDIHTHNRTEEPGVKKIIHIDVPGYLNCCGFDLRNNFSLGIHPWKINAQLLSQDLRFLEENARYDSIKAIGECGLDKLVSTDWELQVKTFQSQIVISEKTGKPLLIHCVKAWDELLAIKKDFQPEQAWIVHGFRGKPQQMEQLLAHGFYLSFGLHFNEETLVQTPLSRLFVETDDAEVSVIQVYDRILECRAEERQGFVSQIEKNFAEIF